MRSHREKGLDDVRGKRDNWWGKVPEGQKEPYGVKTICKGSEKLRAKEEVS